MPTLDPRVDVYIDGAPEFARPILIELRKRVHAACPEVTETIKWRMPSFEHRGMLVGMAAFRRHCTFGFWKEALLGKEPEHATILERVGRIATLADLPPKAAFAKTLKRAVQLNEQGIAVPRGASAKAEAVPHPAFAKALAAHRKAKQVFDAFAPSCKREYVEWIAEAKKDATRARRIAQAIEWLAAGKKRNWKYERG
ncbi:MAG: YdeI/OmpD-associated family protein [Planctomycetes bacterium]|nr:YdeI/OmpD-associated family protein [Planctomycetota bacterium]